MIEQGLDKQTISTKRTDFQPDRVVLLGQVTEKKEEAQPSHFKKFLLVSSTKGTLGFAPTYESIAWQSPKGPFFALASKDFVLNSELTSKVKAL